MKYLSLALALFLGIGFLPAHAQENIFEDGGFEFGGNCSDARSGSKSLEHRTVEPRYFVSLGARKLKVEPFARYRASGYVKSDVKSGTGHALYAYGWNCFGWGFASEVQVKKHDEWTPVSMEFCVPADYVDIIPLVLSHCRDSWIRLDDVSVVKIKTPQEVIAELEAKTNLNTVERQLLARYYAGKKDYVKMLKLKDGGDNYAKADISCLMAQHSDNLQGVKANLIEMLSYEALNWPDAKHRLREMLPRFPLAEQYEICLSAIAKNPNSEKVRESLKYVMFSKDENQTCKKRTALLAEHRRVYERALKRVGKDPAVRQSMEGVAKALDEAEAALAKRRQELGNAKIVLEGKEIGSGTHVIVVPSEATVGELRVADDLAVHLEQISGVALDVVAEDKVGTRYPIFVGKCKQVSKRFPDVFPKLGTDGIFIFSDKSGLVLAGNQRGVHYAVYTFLEEQLGCRWFTEDCFRIPKSGVFKVGGLKKEFIPVLEYRCTDYPSSRPLAFSVRNKYNGQMIPDNETWGGKISYQGFVHTFNGLVPPGQYGAAHPEYYSERNGKRVWEGPSQLCLTNPDVLKITIESVRRWIKANPKATIISVSQNDNQTYCQCAKCTALAEKEGSQMGPLLHFVNAVARDIAKDHPDKIIDTLAYQYTRKPPKFVRPEPNVAIRLCSIECCFVHTLEDCPFNKTFVDDIIGWSKICNRLHIWDYVINYAHCIMPFPNLRVLKPNIQFFIKHGVTGIYEEANYFSKGGELAELRSYMMAKCLWDPEADIDKALFEFTEAYYGAAGKWIRDYLKLIHDNVCSNKKRHVTIYRPPSFYLNDSKMIDAAFALFAKAEEAVAGDPILTHRVKVAKLPIIYTRVTLGRGDAHGLFKRVRHSLVTETESHEDLVEEFAKTCAAEGITRYREGYHPIEQWVEAHSVNQDPLNIISLRNQYVRVDVLPGAGGRIWQVTAGDAQIMRLVGDEEKGYIPYEGGYEEYSTDGHRSPGWREPYKIIDHGLTTIEMEASLSNGRVMRRRIELLGDRPGVKVISKMCHPGNSGKLTFRTHPEFAVTSTANAELVVKSADGKERRIALANPEAPQAEQELWLRGGDCPAGEWRVVDSKSGISIVNRFDRNQVDFCYANWNGAQSRVNLEQWRKTEQVEAGAWVELVNTYEIILPAK